MGIQKFLDRLITAIARHGRIECHECGTFKPKGYPCRGCMAIKSVKEKNKNV